METLQQDINPNMRGILIDWLVEVGVISYNIIIDKRQYFVLYVLLTSSISYQRKGKKFCTLLVIPTSCSWLNFFFFIC